MPLEALLERRLWYVGSVYAPARVCKKCACEDGICVLCLGGAMMRM